MNRNDLFTALNDLDDSVLEQSEIQTTYRKKSPMLKWYVAAACLVIAALGIYCAVHFNFFKGHSGNSSPNAQNEGAVLDTSSSAGGNDHNASSTGRNELSEGGTVGMEYYTGPVFPLTSIDEDSMIKTERSINFELSPSQNQIDAFLNKMGSSTEEIKYNIYNSKSFVTDSYKLINDSDKDLELNLLYPFAGDLNMYEIEIPIITVNGEVTESELKIGPYTGSYTGTDGNPDANIYNLFRLNTWEDYKRIIDDGYLSSALDELPKLDVPVIVYELKDRYFKEDTDATAPYLNMEFKVNNMSDTKILTLNFQGFSVDYEHGLYEYGGFIPQNGQRDAGESAYLIVIGEDIGDYQLKAYTNGACTQELPDAGATVLKYVCKLEDILNPFFDQYGEEWIPLSLSKTLRDRISNEYFLGLWTEMVYKDGPLSDSPLARYPVGRLEETFTDVTAMNRIMYLSFPVTIPANSTITLTAEMFKACSYERYPSSSMSGYDMVTSLASNFAFEKQTASVSGTDSFEIVQQDFGFDIKNGIYTVELNKENPHYSMVVKQK